MKRNYGWIITSDKISNGEDDGVMGPRNASDLVTEMLHDGEGTPFKMYDDDDELYYFGRFVGDEMSEDAFSPLDEFGMPNAGCTRIDYKNPKTGNWEIL